MKITVMTRLLAKRDMYVDSAHLLVVRFKEVVSGQVFSD
jgi:hypothetical protein